MHRHSIKPEKKENSPFKCDFGYYSLFLLFLLLCQSFIWVGIMMNVTILVLILISDSANSSFNMFEI